MMKRIQWTAVCLGAGLLVAGTCSVSPPATKAGDFPRVFKTTSVEKLARKIDDLQEDIDRNGTVVVKKPDVWGEARLTKHRAEYEKSLEAEKGRFKETIQATLKRSDQAFLLQTLAIQAALGGRAPIPQYPKAPRPSQRLSRQTKLRRSQKRIRGHKSQPPQGVRKSRRNLSGRATPPT